MNAEEFRAWLAEATDYRVTLFLDGDSDIVRVTQQPYGFGRTQDTIEALGWDHPLEWSELTFPMSRITEIAVEGQTND